MKYLLILLSLILISCGSTKNKQSSSSIIDTTSTTKTKINTDIVKNLDIKDTTSTTKKDSTSIINDIKTDESSIKIKPLDPKKPTIVEDSKGNKYTVTNGEIDITTKRTEDKTKTINVVDDSHRTGHKDKSKAIDKSDAIIKEEKKGKSDIKTTNKFKRNWTLFPVFLILLVGAIIWFKPYIMKLWNIAKLWFLKI